MHHSNYLLYKRIFLNRWGRKGNIAMFHAARCGSTVIGDLLSKNPELGWAKEIFNKNVYNYIKPDWSRDPIKKTILWHLYGKKCKYLGFETTIMPTQQFRPDIIGMTLEDYVSLLKHTGITHFIILKRENHLRRCISAQLARNKKMYHSRQPVNKPTSLHLDTQHTRIGQGTMPLLELFKLTDERYELLHSLLKPYKTLRITYEADIKESPKIAYARICDFLQVEKVPVETEYQRTNPFPLNQVIENYDEVAGLLKGTAYEWMLTD